jgi:hypothetical protein
VSYGSFYINGLQTGTPSGGQQSLGPFAIAFGDVIDTQTWTVNTSSTIPVPATALGVWIVPPTGSTVALSMKTVSGDTGIYIDPGQPTFINFDVTTPHLPSNLYLVSASSVAVVVQFV